MKIFILAIAVGALRYADDTQAKVQGVIRKHSLPADHVDMPRAHLPTSIESPRKKFNFFFTSEMEPKPHLRLTTALQMVGGLIENSVDFKEPINVRVVLKSDCNGTPDCKVPSVLASCGPYYTRTAEGVRYPRSLAKQLPQLGYTLNVVVDMELTIKIDHNFTFPHDLINHDSNYDSGMPIDILEVLSHEMLHGLGFSSFLNQPLTGPSTSRFSRTPYEKNLFDVHLKTSDGQSISDLIDNLNINPTLYQHELDSLREKVKQVKAIYFQTSKEKVYIQTGGFCDYSHVDSSYYNTTDYIMTAFASAPFKFLERVPLHPDWNTAPIGPGLLNVLETMGYTKNPNPRKEKSLFGIYKELQFAKDVDLLK